MCLSRQLALRLRQSVQGCTLHLHGPVQAWAAVEQACKEGKANRELVARYVIDSCTNRIEELLAAGTGHNDQRIIKERKTRKFVEQLFLAGGSTSDLQTPLLAVATIITHQADQQQILLLRHEKSDSIWELPNGITKIGETAENSAHRNVLEETGLQLNNLKLLGVYSNHVYDEQSPLTTLIFTATGCGTLKKNDEHSVVQYFSLAGLPEIGFDHSNMLADYFKSVTRDKLSCA